VQAVLDPDEIEHAAALGLHVRPQASPPGFALPCPKLDGAHCTIYGQRPRACGRYICRLLQEVRDGRDLATALPVVAEAQRLAADLKATLGPGVTLPEGRAALKGRTAFTPELLKTLALSRYLDKHFRGAHEGPTLDLESF
jgi:hypothetical protein